MFFCLSVVMLIQPKSLFSAYLTGNHFLFKYDDENGIKIIHNTNHPNAYQLLFGYEDSLHLFHLALFSS